MPGRKTMELSPALILIDLFISLKQKMKTKCYSVRLQSLVSISDRAYKAISFDGSTAIVPKSQVFGPDLDVLKSDAYWISAWILERKDLQYSNKKVAWFDEQGNMTPQIYIEHHKPTRKHPVNSNVHDSLTR